MNSKLLLCSLAIPLILGTSGCARLHSSGQAGWQDTFAVDKSTLAPTGHNAWFPLQPGRVLRLGHGNDRLTLSVLPDTKMVDGVTAAVLEEREEKDGRLI